MKINELSSNPRSETEVGVGAKGPSGFVPSTTSTLRWRARWAQLGVAPLQVEGPGTTPRVEADKE